MRALLRASGLLAALAMGLIAGEAVGMPKSADREPVQLQAKAPEGESEVDRLIDRYRSAPPNEKKQLLPEIRARIIDRVTGEQKLAIVEAIKLKKLKQGRSPKKRLSPKPQKKKKTARSRRIRRVKRSCHSVECVMERVRRSIRSFFHKATRKRRRPAPMPSPEEILKGQGN